MNRNILIALTAVALAACTPADAPKSEALQPEAPTAASLAAEAADQASYDAQANALPTEPVAAIEARAEACLHFGGEINGDGSERDREVQARMEELACGDTLSADAAALKIAKAGDAAAIARIDAAMKVANGE